MSTPTEAISRVHTKAPLRGFFCAQDLPRVCASRCAQIQACARVYVHEAILSRFKRLSPLDWYTDTQRISYALRWLVRCFSVSPLVGGGGGLWGWVVCVGVVCSPLPYDWGRVRGCGCPFGGGVHLCVPTQVCVRTYTPAYMGTGAHKRPNLCALLRTDAPPSAPGCVRVRARQRPYTILSPSRLFLSNFSGPPFDLEPKKKPPITYGGLLGNGTS